MTTSTKLEDKILIPFEGKEFYGATADALRELLFQGYEIVFMPQVADARILADNDNLVWEKCYSAPAVFTGRTSGGTPLDIFSHHHNYFSNPDNIQSAVRRGLRNGAGVVPQPKFDELAELADGKTVFRVDHGVLMSSESGAISVDAALRHPFVVPFLGGKERAQEYLKRHKEVFGEKIGVYFINDLGDKPVGRVLFLGGSYYGDLVGNYDLDDNGRFLGVRTSAARQK